MTLVPVWLSSIVLQVSDFAMGGLTCTYMGSSMSSFMGNEAAIPTSASAHTLPIRGTFSIVHSFNCCKVSCTFVRY